MLAALAGAMVFAGWMLLGPEVLREWTGPVYMKTNTALALLLAGVGLVLLIPEQIGARRRWAGRACAMVVLLLGTLTFSENLVGWNLGIDQLLATEPPGAAGVTGPNRIGMPASFSFVLLGPALLLLSRQSSRGRRPLQQPFALVVVLVALLPTIGYLYGASELYLIARYTGIAWPTAVALLALGLGVLCARPQDGLMAAVTADDPGGRTIRLLLLPMILLPLTLGWLRLAGERYGLYEAALGTAMMMLIFIVIFSALVYYAGRRVSQSGEALRSVAQFPDENPYPVMRIDRAGTVLYSNASSTALCGEWRCEIGRPASEPLVRRVRETLDSGQANQMDLESDGRVFSFLFAPIADSGYVNLYGRDITDRKRAEEQIQQINRELEERVNQRTAELRAANEFLRESEQRYRTLFDTIDEGFSVVEMLYDSNGKPLDYRFLEINPAFEKQTGLEQALGKTIRELAPKHDEHWFQIYDQVARSGEAVRFENFATAMNRWFDVYAFRLGGAESRRVAILFNNITERKRMEDELRAKSLYSRSLIEASLDPLVTISPSGQITDVNNATELVTGVGREALIGSDFAEYFTEPEKASAGYQKVLADGWVNDYPLTIRHTSGRTTDVLYNATVYRNEAGEVQGVFAAARDITERKRAEEELDRHREHLEELVAQRTEELARSNKDLEQFAYVASHDLQEPLRAVSGFVTLLQQRYQGKLDEKADGYIANSVDGAARMQSLISDLLTYSRVGTRGGALAPIATQDSLDNALRNLGASIHDAGAVITSDPMPIVPADALQLTQLFQNLIGNAIKFRGERRPEIHVGARREQGHWLFWVRDNGIGIAPEYAERIFLIFQRLHTRKKYAGTGIGLAICKKIVERHGGKIWVESQPNQGATFYFTISDRGEHQ